MKKTIAIIGGGPGGYVAAIRAAQLGAEVHIVEEENLGGTCLNVGCIPTKAMLHTADLYQAVIHGESVGLKADNVRIDWPALLKRKQNVVGRLVSGVEGLLKANKVTIHKGHAVLKDSHTIEINHTTKLKADAIILAVGSLPVKIPFAGADFPGVIDSTGALNLPKIPSSMIIVGGGVIGIEFAGLFSAVGCKVTVVEILPEILPMIDQDIAGAIKQGLIQQGVVFMNEAKLIEVAKGELDGLAAKIEKDGKCREIPAEYVLIAVGRCPNTKGIGLEEVGIKTEKGRIIVDNNFAASIPNIYAIGDCNGLVMLAHAASAQGIAAAEHVMGHNTAYFPETIPSCIYTHPEAASVGLTEDQVKQRNISYKVGKFALAGNGKALIDKGDKGIIKIIAGAKYGEILGVHIYGPRATDLIAEAALALRLEATVDELISTIHAHPTVSEAMAEAALDVEGITIHWPPVRKL